MEENTVTLTPQEDRQLAMAIYYTNSGDCTLVSYSLIVKLAAALGITPTHVYQDPMEFVPDGH